MEIEGLSPRVQGSPARPCAANRRRGSIPACAGEPRLPLSPGRGGRVYPRVCRGASPSRTIRAFVRGLSPRVQGSRVRVRRGVMGGGSIPACAGEPRSPRWTRGAIKVYPRVCRGAASSRRCAGAGPGLSPRVQGSLAREVRGFNADGSIPACAGEPFVRPSGSRSFAVYPRVCRGARARFFRRQCLRGLSPRVQGSRLSRLHGHAFDGSIPACAGEPRAVQGHEW